MSENLNTLYYSLGLDDREMQEGLKKAITNLASLDNEFNRINENISKTFGKKIQTSPIHNEIKGLKGELQDLEKQWSAMTAAERRGAQGTELRAKYEALRKEAGDLNNSLGRLYSESQKAASGQTGLASQLGLVNKELTLQGRLASNVKTLFTTFVSVFAVKSFIQNLAQVRGEFELQQVSLRAILRDAEAADKIFGQIKEFSVVSPFEFKDLVGYAKQLSAFQIPVNELFDTTKRLADVSAGLGVGMDRIILAYGQVKAATVLRGQELRQFTEAGIPLVDELAKKFSELEGRVVSAGDVFEKISNRTVSFGMVKEIFEDLTNEGGMFYMMQEKQAESLKGKIANLADAYAIMLNDIGEANDGILKGGVEDIAALMQNWEKVWAILKSIIVAYGAYKGAILAVAAAQKIQNLGEQITMMLELRKSLGLATAAQQAFNATTKANPYVLVASLILGAITAIYSFADANNKAEEEANNASVALVKEQDRVNGLINKLKELTNISGKSNEVTKERIRIYNELKGASADVASQIDLEKTSLEELIKIQEEYNNKQSTKKQIQRFYISGGFDDAIKEVEEAGDKLISAQVKMEDNYIRFKDRFEKISQRGVNVSGGATEKLTESDVESLNKIYNSTKKGYEKQIDLMNWYAQQYSLSGDVINGVMSESTRKRRDLLDGMFEGVDKGFSDYKRAIGEVSRAETDYQKKLEQSVSKFKVSLESKYGSTESWSEETKALIANLINSLETDEKFKLDIKIRLGVNVEQIKIDKVLEGWRKSVEDIAGEFYRSEIANNETELLGILEQATKRYSELADEKKKLGAIDLTTKDNDKEKKYIQDKIAVINKEIKAQGDLLKYYNQPFPTEKRDKGKDPRIESLENQIKLIEEAQKAYEKLNKYMGKEKTGKSLSPIYQTVDFKQNEKGNVDFSGQIQRKITEIVTISKEAGKKAQESFDKGVRSEKTQGFEDNIKDALDAITKQIDSYKGKYDFYEQILGLGGTQELAFSFSGIESGNLVEEIKKMTLDAVKKVNPTITIETVLDQKDLPEQVQKLVDAANKAVDEAKKNSLLSAAKLLTMESPEGMGMSFDLGNIVKKYGVELLKLQNELRSALNAEDLTDEQKKQIQSNQKLAIDANTKIYTDKARKSGAVYAQEQIEISGLGEAFKNMSTASYESLLKMLEITEKAKKDLISGVDAVSGFKNAGFKDEDAKRLGSEDPVFANLFNAEDLEQFQLLLEEIENLLNSSDTTTITSKLGIKTEDIDKLKLWVSQQKGAAIAVGNTQREINKFRIDRIVKMLGDLGKNLDGAIDGIKGLSSVFGGEMDKMTEGALDLLSTIVSSTTNVISTISATTQASAAGMVGASQAASTAIKTVEKASVILAVIGAALQIATAIANIFAKDKQADIDATTDAIKRLQDVINDVSFEKLYDPNSRKFLEQELELRLKNLSALKEELELKVGISQQKVEQGTAGALSMGFTDDLKNGWKTGFDFLTMGFSSVFRGFKDSASKGWGAVLNKMTFGVSGLIKMWTNKTAIKNYKTELAKINIELEYANKLKKIMESGDNSLAQAGQAEIANLQMQNKLIDENLKREKDKKAKNIDWGAINEMEKQQAENREKMYNAHLKNLKDQIGDVFNDLSNSISDSLLEAFENGTSAADAFDQSVDDVMKNVIKNLFKVNVVGKQLEGFNKKWLSAMGIDPDNPEKVPDYFLTPEELQGLQDEANSAKEGVLKGWEEYEKLLKQLGIGNEEPGVGLSQGIKEITEDTAQLLASYLNAIRGSVLLQELYMKNIDLNVAGIYQAMGGSPNITTINTIPPEIIAAISEPFRINNEFLRSIDLNIGNIHSIAANCQAQLVMIQANTFNNANTTSKILERLDSVITAWPKGGNAIKAWV